MRICHVLDHSAPLFSGYVFRTLKILSEQKALGWSTCQLTGPKQGRAPYPIEVVNDLSFYRTRPPGSLLRVFPIINQVHTIWATARRLMEVARAERPDILHAHSPCLNGLAALVVGRRMGIPVVYEMRATWEDAAVNLSGTKEGGLRYRASQALESYVLKRADAIVTICEGLTGEVVGRGISRGRVTIVPNAVDADQFSVLTERDSALAAELGIRDRPTAGFVGSFYDYEGLDFVIDAVPRLLERVPDAAVLFVGDGPVSQDLVQRAADSGVGKHILFCGRVPHDDVARYYSLIDVCVYARKAMRLTELTTPLKPLEAMAQGKIVLASDVGGHRELIDDGHTGYLFPAGDTERLADSLTRLLLDVRAQAALRSRARYYVEHERTWQTSVMQYETAYRRLLEPGST